MNNERRTFRYKDIVAYKTNQPQVHLLEMFGHETFNPNDIETEEYIGWIKTVISKNEYLIATISPLQGFVCLANLDEIVRRVDVDELTDEQRENIREFYMAPNLYMNHRIDDDIKGMTIDEQCCHIARKAMMDMFPDNIIEEIEFVESDFIKEKTISDLYWCIENFTKNVNAKRIKELTNKANELATLFKTLRFKEYFSVNVGVRQYGSMPEFEKLNKMVAEQMGCDISEIKSEYNTCYYLVAIDKNFEEVSIKRNREERSAFYMSLGPEYDILWNAKTNFAHECH